MNKIKVKNTVYFLSMVLIVTFKIRGKITHNAPVLYKFKSLIIIKSDKLPNFKKASKNV